MTTNTPEQARALWCPMVRLAAVSDGRSSVPDNQSVMNRLQVGIASAVPDAARCIADKCAMWRWATKPHQPGEPTKVDLSQSVELLGLAKRYERALWHSGIKTLGELVVLRFTELSNLPEIGLKAIREIKNALAVHGLELSTQQQTNHPPGSGFCGLAGHPEVMA